MKNQIKLETFSVLQIIITGGFAIFNLIVAFNLFHSFSENHLLKWVYSGVGVLWDSALLLTIILIKTSIKEKKTGAVIGYLLSYSVLLLLGIIGAVGFNIASSDQQSLGVERENSSYIIASQAIENNNLSVALHYKNANNFVQAIEKLPADYVSAREKASLGLNRELDNISDLQEDNKIQQAIIDSAPMSTEIAANNIFQSTGKIVGLSGDTIKNIVFILFICMIHVVLFMNAPMIVSKSKVTSINRRSIEKFIDALFNVSGVRLASDEIIIQSTGLDEKEVKEIRQFLFSLPSYNGQSLLVRGKGIGTKSSVSLDTFKTLVKVHLNFGQ